MGAAASPPPSPPPQTIVPQSQQVDEVNSTEVVVAVAEEVSVAVPPASSSDSGAGPSTTTECVICLAELDESGEPLDALSAYGLCCALAAKKGYRNSRSGAPDPHRAALLIARDCAQGALPLVSRVLDR